MDEGLIDELFERLAPLPSERAVMSVLLRRDEDWRVTHGSVLIGPPAMGSLSWGDWGRRELDNELLLSPPGLASSFELRDADLLAVRQSVTVRQARHWLGRAYTRGEAPALGLLPAATSPLREPRAPSLARPGNSTPASDFVMSTVRPVVGFLFRGDEAPAVKAREEWTIEQQGVSLRKLLGIDVPTDSPNREGPFAEPAVLLGRVSRRAWMARIRYKAQEEKLHVWLRMERKRTDSHDLEIEVQEHIGGDLADSRRLRLAEIPLPAKTRGRLMVKLPTLGRGLQRTVSLYHRDGELLDRRTEFNLLERIEMTMSVDGAPQPPIVVGEKRSPATVAERLVDLRRVEEEYAWWLERGVRRRVISGRDVTAYVKSRLRRAVGELLIIDSYFGKSASDWDLLDGVNVPVRILTGPDAHRPPTPLAGAVGRVWNLTTAHPIPWHDRFYLWGEASGLNVGASPNGFAGRQLFRIDELSGAEARALKVRFEGWWTHKRTRAL